MIRLAREQDIPRLLEIYTAAKAFMRKNGNTDQWTGQYPDAETLGEDVALDRLYVVEQDGHMGGCFMLAAGPDDTYAVIKNGAWSDHRPYGVIHRIAGDGSIKGLLALAVEFAGKRFDYLRIDTHEKNIPMQNALKKQHFTQRGVIYIHDGSPRLAYDRILSSKENDL